MPRVSKRKKRRRLEYTAADEKEHLLTGHDFIGGFGRDEEAMREAWEDLRDDLLADWTREHPGTRPWAWWRYDAPERRRRTDGPAHPFDNPKRTAHVKAAGKTPEASRDYRERMFALHYGKPKSLCVPDDFAALYETETAYLQRLGLLTDGERKALGLDR